MMILMKLINQDLCGVKMVYNDLENMLNEYNWDNGFEIPKEILADPITEDDQKKAEKDLQDMLDKYIKKVDAALAAKDKELMSI